MADRQASSVSVERLMLEIEGDLRGERRERVLARGGASEYRSPEVFAAVEGVLRRAIESRDHEALLIPEILADDEDWRLRTHLRFNSHRAGLGPIIIFVKRRILLPLTRWLYEYSLENFRRQQRINQLLFACLEELALENARLRKQLDNRPTP